MYIEASEGLSMVQNGVENLGILLLVDARKTSIRVSTTWSCGGPVTETVTGRDWHQNVITAVTGQISKSNYLGQSPAQRASWAPP